MDLAKVIPADELRELLETVAQTEADFGLRSGFLVGLLSEADDWSFIVKTHAFLESAVNLLICNHLGKPELEHPISKIGILQRTRLAAAMQLIPRDEELMIEELGVLRNRLVHNPKNTDFSLAKHLESPDSKAKFARTFSVAWSRRESGATDRESEEMALSQPHLAIWMSSLLVALRSGTARAQKDLEKLERELGRSVRGPLNQLLTVSRSRQGDDNSQ